METRMSTEKNIQIVKNFLAAMGNGEREALLALSAEDIEWIIPGSDWLLAGTYRGHAGLADLLRMASEAMETSFTKPPEFVAQEDRVMVIGVATAKVTATDNPLGTDLRLGLAHRPTEIDAPCRVLLAAIVFQRHEIALAIAGLVLIRSGPVFDQPPCCRHSACSRHSVWGGHSVKLLLGGVELCSVAIARHRDIAQMPVHCRRRHDEGPVDGRPMVLVDGRRIALAKLLVTFGIYADQTGSSSGLMHLAVEPHLYRVVLDGMHRYEHPVPDAKVAVVLQKHDPISLGKLSPAVVGLIGKGLRSLLSTVRGELPPIDGIDLANRRQFTTLLQRAADGVIDGTTSTRRCAIAMRLPSGRASRSAR
jgi:ketosteroid isomerase-like protein